MNEWIEAALERIRGGRDCVLVSVVATSGSTPRGPGARMLADARGLVCGTVGGGPVEHDAVRRATERLERSVSAGALKDYRLAGDRAADLGVCGGGMRLYFQTLPAGDGALIDLLERARAAADGARDAWLITDLEDGGMTLSFEAVAPEDGQYAQQIASGATCYLFGCGHVAQALVPVLARALFRVCALDDRADFADRRLFPDAAEVRLVDFGDLAFMDGVTGADYVAIMTRGHQHDFAALKAALRTPARYIGMMGSQAKRASVYERARAAGFTEADLKRVRCPIGLPIGAQTPYEIAISIAAEMIQARTRA